MSGPNETLKARHTTIYWQDGFPYPVVTFDDGSIWRQKGLEWFSIWLPEPNPVEERPRPVAVNPLEDFLDKLRNGHEKAKWDVIPGGIEIHHEADIKRIAELEQEVMKWELAATIASEDIEGPKALDDWISKTKLELKRLRANIIEWEQAACPVEAKFVEQYYTDGITPERLRNMLKNLWSKWRSADSDFSELRKETDLAFSKLKAWQDAASVDLAENKDEPTIPCKTPEELIERLRSLYRWASTAEKRANEAEAELAAHKDAYEKAKSQLAEWEAAANHQAKSKIESPDELRNRINALEVEVAAMKARPQGVPPLEEVRVIATAAKIAAKRSSKLNLIETRFWTTVREVVFQARDHIGGRYAEPYETK